MNRPIRALAAATAWTLVCVALAAQTADPRLTAADVEKVSGLAGIHAVARMSQPGAGGALNFVGADNHLVVMVNFGPAELYRRARNQKELNVGGTMIPMPLYHADVSGVGDEAFSSPPGPVQYILYARKGDKAISVSTYLRPGASKGVLTIDQLKQLASIIFSR